MIKSRRVAWLALLVIVPLAVLLALYGASGYMMLASMSVAMNMESAQASALARRWLFLIAASLSVAIAGGAILWRCRGSA